MVEEAGVPGANHRPWASYTHYVYDLLRNKSPFIMKNTKGIKVKLTRHGTRHSYIFYTLPSSDVDVVMSSYTLKSLFCLERITSLSIGLREGTDYLYVLKKIMFPCIYVIVGSKSFMYNVTHVIC